MLQGALTRLSSTQRMAMAMHRIFVYGTLKRGQPNYHLLEKPRRGTAKFLGAAKLTKSYPMVVASTWNVPVVLAEEGKGKVVMGEVYEVDDAVLEVLDELEMHPDSYTRTPTQCVLEGSGGGEEGRVVECEAYIMFDFREELLSLPMIDCYDSCAPGLLPYVPPQGRKKGNSLKHQMKKSSTLALHRVFVYGTLKRGLPNYHLFEKPHRGTAKFLGAAKLTKSYPLIVTTKWNVPMLLPEEGKGKEVMGELYEVDDAMLEVLDELEHHPDIYTRTPTQCVLEGPGGGGEEGRTMECETYFVFDFREELLSLPMIGCYDNRPEFQSVDQEDGAIDSFTKQIKTTK